MALVASAVRRGVVGERAAPMKCPHRTAPWFINYFCHDALKTSDSYSVPFTGTTRLAHTHGGATVSFLSMQADNVRIRAQRKARIPFQWHVAQQCYIYMAIWEDILHMSGLLLNLKTRIYHVPGCSKHVYTVQLSRLYFFTHFSGFLSSIVKPSYTISGFNARADDKVFICTWHVTRITEGAENWM